MDLGWLLVKKPRNFWYFLTPTLFILVSNNSKCGKLCVEAAQNLTTLDFPNATTPVPLPPKKVAFISPTKNIPLQLKYLIVFDDNASHAGGIYPIRDILVDLVNANKTLLPAYQVGVKTYDTKYNIDYNVGKTVRLFMTRIANEAYIPAENTTDVCDHENIFAPLRNACITELKKGHRAFPLFYGPGYSAEAKVLAQLAPLYNLVQISDGAGAPDLSDKTKYPTFYRTVLNSDEQVPLPRALCNHFNITTVYLATLDESYASDPMDKIDFDLHTHNITVLSKSKFQTRNNDTIDLFLDSLRLYDGRIIFFWSNEYDEYHIFCRSIDRWRAYNEQFLSAKYLVLFMSLDEGAQILTPPDLSDVPGCSKSALASMLNGSLVTLSPTWGPPAARLDWGMSTAEFTAKAEQLGRTKYKHKTGKLVPLVSLSIDALWLGFLTLDAVDRRLRAEKPTPRTLLDFSFESHDIVQMVKEELVKTRFRGVTGDVAFNAKGDIVGEIVIQQYRPGHASGEFVPVLNFDTANQSLIDIATEPLVFGTADGRIPPDKPPPPALAGGLLITVLIIIIGGFIVLVCVVVLSGYFMYKRKLLAASLNSPAWLVDSRFLVMRDAGGMSARSSLLFGRSISSDAPTDINPGHKTALLNEQTVRIQTIPTTASPLPRNLETHKFLTTFRDNVQHPNLVRWFGYTTMVTPATTAAKTANGNSNGFHGKSRKSSPITAAAQQYLLWEHCEKGSLEHLIENDAFNLDTSFECAIMLDVAQGMAFLHKCSVVSYAHGGLCAEACVIDKRFSVKVADHGDKLLASLFGLNSLHEEGDQACGDDKTSTSLYSERKLYWAPELLRNSAIVRSGGAKRGRQPSSASYVLNPLQAADIYSYAITMHVLLTRAPPFDSHGLPADRVLELVRDSSRTPPFRPETTSTTTRDSATMGRNSDVRLMSLLQSAWAEEPSSRPPFKDIVRQLQLISGVKAGSSVTDQLLQRLERYASDMEQLVAERTQELEAEHKRADELLNSMLPPEIATELKRHGQVHPESFEQVTIYFSDIVGFTTLSSSSTPIEVVNLLNALYTVFDMQIDMFDTYKVETIGDAYMVVSGLPRRNGIQHVAEIAKLSLALLDVIQSFVIPHRPAEKLRLRIGMHTGPCVAGVVGIKMPRYCLFGDTVNTASRMESTGEALRIHMSEVAKHALDVVGGFTVEERGLLEVKGKGTMLTYWLLSASESNQQNTYDEPV